MPPPQRLSPETKRLIRGRIGEINKNLADMVGAEQQSSKLEKDERERGNSIRQKRTRLIKDRDELLKDLGEPL